MFAHLGLRMKAAEQLGDRSRECHVTPYRAPQALTGLRLTAVRTSPQKRLLLDMLDHHCKADIYFK
jgi:hypothetical protein